MVRIVPTYSHEHYVNRQSSVQSALAYIMIPESYANTAVFIKHQQCLNAIECFASNSVRIGYTPVQQCIFSTRGLSDCQQLTSTK